MQDDDKWLGELRRGESDAFGMLVSDFEAPLYRYFVASHGDPQLAAEQSADCFADLVPAIRKMHGGPDQLRPFVFAVARNVLRRTWRKRSTKALPLEEAADSIDLAPSPVAIASDRDDLKRLFQALDKLDDETREVFILRYIEQFSLTEVATLTGDPLGTIKSRIHRGREKLKELLESNAQR